MYEVREWKVSFGELWDNSFSRYTKMVKLVKKNWEIVCITNTSNCIWHKGKLHTITYIIIHPITGGYLKKNNVDNIVVYMLWSSYL